MKLSSIKNTEKMSVNINYFKCQQCTNVSMLGMIIFVLLFHLLDFLNLNCNNINQQ